MPGPHLKRFDRLLWPLAACLAAIGRRLPGRGEPAGRVLIVRPGGLGDLVLCCIACEMLGRDPREFVWLIEKRTEPWARHLGLDYACYDRIDRRSLGLRARFPLVINSEQRFGLAQATALLALAPGGVRLYLPERLPATSGPRTTSPTPFRG